jgi:hypothetical protein
MKGKLEMKTMRFAALSCVALVTLSTSFAATAMTLHNSLGDDQRRETLRITIDDGDAQTLTVDADEPHASVDLPVTGKQHRYRIEGESEGHDGAVRQVSGGGLIVTQARLDEIAEEPTTAVAALNAYRALMTDLARAAPAERVAILLPGTPVRASAAQVTAAEKRLGVTLPEGYKRLVTTVGSFKFDKGAYVSAEVYAPDALAPLVDVLVRELRENGSDADDVKKIRERAVRRFPRSGKDIALDIFSSDEPTVLVANGDCDGGLVPLAFPESDYQLLGIDPADNPFLGLITYENDIVGEMQCLSYDRLFAYSLHDQIIDMGDDVIYLRDTTDAQVLVRRAGEDESRVWLAFADLPADDDSEDEADGDE